MSVLDKELILFSEDEDLSYIQELLSQWPDLARRILVWPAFGVGGLASGEAYAKLRKCLGIRLLVHRDRDFMSDTDISAWRKKRGFDANNISLWVPPGADIESAFCEPDHIKRVFDLDDQQVQTVIQNSLKKFDREEVERDFDSALNSAIRELKKDERSFVGQRWRDLGEFGRGTIKGKTLFASIKGAVKELLAETPEAPKLGRMSQLSKGDADHPLCSCLRSEIERVITQPVQVQV